MLGGDRIFVGPAEDALADRHRVNAEFAEGGALEFAIGRMIFNPLHVAAEAIALMQHRHVAVGEPPAIVEMAAGKPAEALKMRLDVTKQFLGQVDPQQIRKRRIGTVEIHPRGVWRQKVRLTIKICHAILRVRLH
jgi:hypothetical protein